MYARVIDGVVTETMGLPPKNYTFADDSKTGNFDIMYERHIEQGYYPVDVIMPDYNPLIETVDYTDEIQVDKVVRTYTTVPIPLPEIKAKCCADVEALLAERLAGSQFTFGDQIFNFRQQVADDAVQLQTLISIGGQPITEGFGWTQANGDEYPMDEQTFIQFAGAIAAHKLGLINTSKSHIATIKSLATAQAVAEYDYETGW